jgi:hypothetical protein
MGIVAIVANFTGLGIKGLKHIKDSCPKPMSRF